MKRIPQKKRSDTARWLSLASLVLWLGVILLLTLQSSGPAVRVARGGLAVLGHFSLYAVLGALASWNFGLWTPWGALPGHRADPDRRRPRRRNRRRRADAGSEGLRVRITASTVLSLPGSGERWRTVTTVGLGAGLVGLFWGLFDEWLQSFVPGRDASLGDVGVDVLGAVFGGVVVSLLRQWYLSRRTGDSEG